MACFVFKISRMRWYTPSMNEKVLNFEKSRLGSKSVAILAAAGKANKFRNSNPGNRSKGLRLMVSDISLVNFIRIPFDQRTDCGNYNDNGRPNFNLLQNFRSEASQFTTTCSISVSLIVLLLLRLCLSSTPQPFGTTRLQ